MHVEDVEHDLENRDLVGLEDAFRALVADEDAIDDVDSADDMTALLVRVCDALEGDTRFMPGQVVDLIRDETDGVLADTTYAAGAEAMKGHIERWRKLFEATCIRSA